jgi:hypothetical protein
MLRVKVLWILRRGPLRGEKWVQFFSQRDQDEAENFEKFEVTGSDWV